MRRFGDLLRDFGNWTSAHGIPRVATAKTSALRAFWILVVLVSVALFLWQFVQLMQKFLAFDVRVNTEVIRIAPAYFAISYPRYM